MNAAQYILIIGVRVYRWTISPAKTFLFGPLGQCRFTPTCSAYALDAIVRHGALVGSWLAFKRIGRCHPWGGCGEDPVPSVRLGRKSDIQNPKSERNPGAEIRSLKGGLPGRWSTQIFNFHGS
jgi:uncharacterized protein